ncbi:MFS transporter [Ahrensia sp. 13_GOM-1096m]|uniref:MFS transporter n=1 Tax=Ahrensia sp. 13_GOM-1096m TaxID=1380380 RepID=UPI00047DFDDF|nr:MFS transporter [Ahrensia sp. 13_GOM-1096m]
MKDRGSNLTLARIIIYALPAMPLAALTLPLYILVPTFYSETLGLSLTSVGAALLFVRIIDAINDPLIGYGADKLRVGFGRRRTLFALSLPLTAFAALMIFWPPIEATIWYLAFWGAVLSFGYTACLIPFYAWGAEMAGDYEKRTTITAWREALTLIGTLIAIALPFAIGTHNANGFHGLALLGIVIALTLPLLGSLTIWKVPEPREYTRQAVSFTEGIQHLKNNRPFLRLIAAFFVNGLANGIPATLFLYFVSDYLGAPETRGPLLFLYFMCGVAGVPLAAFIAKRTSKHRAWAYGMLAATIIFAFTPLLSHGDVMAFAFICAMTGLLVGFDLSLPASIQADVIDIDTAASGEQRSGTYFAAWSLSTKMSLALAVGFAFPLLGLFGFQPEISTQQSDTSLSALAVIYAWIPALLKLGAVALIWNFPLTEEMQRELRSKIESN